MGIYIYTLLTVDIFGFVKKNVTITSIKLRLSEYQSSSKRTVQSVIIIIGVAKLE